MYNAFLSRFEKYFQMVLTDDNSSGVARFVLNHPYYGASSGLILAAASFMACSGVPWPLRATCIAS